MAAAVVNGISGDLLLQLFRDARRHAVARPFICAKIMGLLAEVQRRDLSLRWWSGRPQRSRTLRPAYVPAQSVNQCYVLNGISIQDLVHIRTALSTLLNRPRGNHWLVFEIKRSLVIKRCFPWVCRDVSQWVICSRALGQWPAESTGGAVEPWLFQLMKRNKCYVNVLLLVFTPASLYYIVTTVVQHNVRVSLKTLRIWNQFGFSKGISKWKQQFTIIKLRFSKFYLNFSFHFDGIWCWSFGLSQ